MPDTRQTTVDAFVAGPTDAAARPKTVTPANGHATIVAETEFSAAEITARTREIGDPGRSRFVDGEFVDLPSEIGGSGRSRFVDGEFVDLSADDNINPVITDRG